MLTADPLAPYRRLVELAETECALVQAGHLDELNGLQAEWDATRRLLPAVPPRAAGPLLTRALTLASQSELGLQAHRVRLQRELGEVDHSRAVGRAYAPASAAGAVRSIDTAA